MFPSRSFPLLSFSFITSVAAALCVILLPWLNLPTACTVLFNTSSLIPNVHVPHKNLAVMHCFLTHFRLHGDSNIYKPPFIIDNCFLLFITVLEAKNSVVSKQKQMDILFYQPHCCGIICQKPWQNLLDWRHVTEGQKSMDI